MTGKLLVIVLAGAGTRNTPGTGVFEQKYWFASV